jgi:hypothetical protein
MVMFGHLYYFFGLILFLSNFGFLINFFRIQKTKYWIDTFFKVTKRKPNADEIKIEDYNRVISLRQLFIVDFFWLFFGLVTSSWKFFLLILVYNFFINIIIRKVEKFKKISILFEYSKLIIISASIGVSVINHFHLHIDLYKYFITLLGF